MTITAQILHTHDEKPPKLKWWKPFWIVIFISMIGSGITFYFFADNKIIFILSEIMLFLVLLVAYYIRVKPSKIVNKVVYIAFGTFAIGFGLFFVFALICGITGLGVLLLNFKPAGPWIL
ncbi:MAG: hypothetical protein JW776_16615 [Candidatus Lokiarchaeota archaeon]|nr:hypothetical protein [Candidatus Lokiarchaeota archaeon]